MSLPRFDFESLKLEGAYVVTNAKHSAFAYAGEYDEKGSVTPVEEFKRNHSSFWTRFGTIRDINGAFRLQPLV